MNMPTGAVKQQQINAAIATVQREMTPWVRHEAAQSMLKDVATRVVWRTSERLDLPSLGLFPYFDFRSESEQARIHEPSQD